MSDDAWMELLLDIVVNEEALCIQLLIELIQYRRDMQCATVFINLFGVDILTKLPLAVQQSYMEADKDVKAKEKDKKEDFYQTKLDNIIFVDDEIKFNGLLDEFEKHKSDYANVIGLDCEWRPCFGFEQDDLLSGDQLRVSTLQISNRKTSYIIDMTFFINTLSDEIIDRFANLILFSADIIKLGKSKLFLSSWSKF